MTITKRFVQKHISSDIEARYWDWIDTNETYEDLTKKLKDKWDSWFDGVRVVEKAFDDETFIITIKVIKTFIRQRNWNWNTLEWYTEYKYYEN